MEKNSRVCVTGAASYIGSWLVNKLLQRGHVVHATRRNIGDPLKTGILNRFSGAESRLLLFQADIYDPDKFEAAIQGCEFVFLVATPLQHNPNGSQLKNTTEAAVAAIRSIMLSCERSGSVKRVIYTGSVTSSSPLKEDGTGYKDCIDESCWTPIDLLFEDSKEYEKHKRDPSALRSSVTVNCRQGPDDLPPKWRNGSALNKDYVSSKTLSEKEILSFNNKAGNRGIEVVSLVCGLVGGDALHPYVPGSIQVMVSPLTGDQMSFRLLKFLQALLGLVPLVHIEDVSEAHDFCIERPSMAGRFLCASSNPTLQELVDYYQQNYPELLVKKEVERVKSTEYRSTKLTELGFEYKYKDKEIIDGSVECAKKLGGLSEVESS